MNIFEELSLQEASLLFFRYLSSRCSNKNLQATSQQLFNARAPEALMESSTYFGKMSGNNNELFIQHARKIQQASQEERALTLNAVKQFLENKEVSAKKVINSNTFNDRVKLFASFHDFFQDALIVNNGEADGNQMDAVNELFANHNRPILHINYDIYKNVFTPEQKKLFDQNEDFLVFSSMFSLMNKLSVAKLAEMEQIWGEMQKALIALENPVPNEELAQMQAHASDLYAFHRLYNILDDQMQKHMLAMPIFSETKFFIDFAAAAKLNHAHLMECYRIFYTFQDVYRGEKPFLPDQPLYAMLAFFINENNYPAIAALSEVYQGDFRQWATLFAPVSGVMLNVKKGCAELFSSFANDQIGRRNEKIKLFEFILYKEMLLHPHRNTFIAAFPLYTQGVLNEIDNTHDNDNEAGVVPKRSASRRAIKKPARLTTDFDTTNKQKRKSPAIGQTDSATAQTPSNKPEPLDLTSSSDDIPLSQLHSAPLPPVPPLEPISKKKISETMSLNEAHAIVSSNNKSKHFMPADPEPRNTRKNKRKAAPTRSEPRSSGIYPDNISNEPSERSLNVSPDNAQQAAPEHQPASEQPLLPHKKRILATANLHFFTQERSDSPTSMLPLKKRTPSPVNEFAAVAQPVPAQPAQQVAQLADNFIDLDLIPDVQPVVIEISDDDEAPQPFPGF